MTDFTDAELREAEHYLEGSIVPVTGMCGPCNRRRSERRE